jgi:hypothetical protein
MPDAPELPKDQGYQVQTAFDTNRNLPLVVGRTKISGTVVAKELSDDYQYLHVFYAVCVSDANFTATVESVTIAGQSDEDSEPVWENGSMTTGTRFTDGKLSIYISNGTGFGSDPTNAGCTIYDSSTMRFEGMVAVYARYKYDREVYRGEPALEFIVNGVDSNPAAALELYLKDSRYGAGIPVSNINESSFDAAIYLCDENVDTEDKYLLSNDFVTRSRYTYNGILDTGKELSENMQDLITVMDGNLVVSEGEYTLLLNAKGDAVFDFNQENVIGKIEENTNSSEQRYNTAEIKFTDKELDYKTNSAIYVDEDAKNNRDNGIELKKTVTVNGVVHFDEAMDFAEKLVKKSSYNRQVKLTSAWENDVEVGEIVSVTYEQFGYTGKEYRVAEKDISISGTIDYVLNEHEDNIYDIENDNEKPSQGVLTYPNPFAKPPAVTNVSLTEVSQSKFNVSFDEINSSVVDTYELSMVRNSDLVTYKFYSNQSPIFGEISEAGTYTYSIVAINDLQIRGTATTGQSYVAGGFEQEWDNVIGANKPQDNATKNEFKGAWSNSTSYAIGDVVSYDSSSYVAIAASTNSTPSSNPSDWTLLAAKGDALTITNTQKVGDTTVITFSDNTQISVSDGQDGTGSNAGVIVLYSSVENPSSNTQVSLTAGSNIYITYYEYLDTFTDSDSDGIPDDAHTKTFVKFIGSDGVDNGVIAIYSSVANPTSDAQLSLAAGSNEYVTFYEWSEAKPSAIPTDAHQETFVRFVGTNGTNGADGADGSDGTSIVFQGTFASAPSSPQNGWSYYNSTDKKSYVYQSGTWYQMAIDGTDGQDGNDGLDIVWKGDSATPPSNPVKNWVYRDTDNGYVYIYNGSAWELMVLDGADGADGADGSDGADGYSVFIVYHSNDAETPPTPPTTALGTNNGWVTTATAGANWMCQKVGYITDNNWGAAILIKGDTGSRGTAVLTSETTDGHTLTSNAVATLWNSVAPSGYDAEIEGDQIVITSSHATGGGTKIYTYVNDNGSLVWQESASLYIDGDAIIEGTVWTGGSVLFNSQGAVKSDNASIDGKTGVFLGYHDSNYQFLAGNAIDYIYWDGNKLSLSGEITGSSLEANGVASTLSVNIGTSSYNYATSIYGHGQSIGIAGEGTSIGVFGESFTGGLFYGSIYGIRAQGTLAGIYSESDNIGYYYNGIRSIVSTASVTGYSSYIDALETTTSAALYGANFSVICGGFDDDNNRFVNYGGDIYGVRASVNDTWQASGRNAYAGYFVGNVYVTAQMSVGSFVDRFTAAHHGLVSDYITDLEEGDIVVDYELDKVIDINNTIFKIRPSTSQCDRPIGVFNKKSNYIPYGQEYEGILDIPEGYSNNVFNAIGEGMVNVCGQAGDLQNGDLIQCSDMAGKGMRQNKDDGTPDDIIRNITVAKVRGNWSFESADEVKMVPCIYLCG